MISQHQVTNKGFQKYNTQAILVPDFDIQQQKQLYIHNESTSKYNRKTKSSGKLNNSMISKILNPKQL
jgi:hypothetical protein